MYQGRKGGRTRRVTRAAAGVLSLVAMLVAVPRSVDAQSASRRAPASADSVRLVADLFFRAVADERWDAAAALVDTTVIRRLVADQLRRPPQTFAREMTIEDFMRDDPDKPLVVAEYELKRYQKMTSRFDEGVALSYQFAGVRSIDALRALTTRQAAVAYIKARDFRVQLREQARLSGCGDTTTTIPYSIRRILATAVASDTAAYVLYENEMFSMSADPGFPGGPSVMILRVRDSAWKIVPTSLMDPGMAFSVSSCDTTLRKSPR
jgi:hypothetical protein